MTQRAQARVREIESHFRMEGEAGRTLVGYAAKYGVLSKIIREPPEPNGFREVLEPGVFDDSVKQDVHAYAYHKRDSILGTTVAGTLRLTADDIGLRFELDLPRTQAGEDVLELVGRGDLRGCSFGFNDVGGGDFWTRDADGVPVCHLRKIDLYEISVVARPAYPGTELSLRSLPDPPPARHAPASTYLALLDVLARA